MVINLRTPPTLSKKKQTSFVMKVSSKLEGLDLKRDVLPIKPGHLTTVKVLPEIVDIANELFDFDLEARQCKFAHEKINFIEKKPH